VRSNHLVFTGELTVESPRDEKTEILLRQIDSGLACLRRGEWGIPETARKGDAKTQTHVFNIESVSPSVNH
jgi:hypothetical protein